VLKIQGHFDGTYCLHPQGGRVSKSNSQQEAGGKQSQKQSARLHGIISQKAILFIVTAVRTSDPKEYFQILQKFPVCC
jgi:hypothetical protein